MGINRPSWKVVLATVLAAAGLSTGGYLLGKRGEVPVPPATVPVERAQAPAAGEPIIVPSTLDLPTP